VGTILDSSVLIAAERGQLDLDRLVEKGGDEPVALAAITASELLHGVHRLGGVRRARAGRFVEELLGMLPVVPFDLDVARVHAVLSADLQARGTAVGAHDLLIASTAVYLGYDVATRDLRSFPKIKDLTVHRW
jgi:predicted nucleic acid-binding protein